jgi:hypothetical protein
MNKYYLKVTMLTLTFSLTSVVSDAQRRMPENVPVGFYGKVIDQDGHAVVGAEVSLEFVVSHMDEDRTETRPITLQTDQDGQFIVTGVIGYGIDKLLIRKEGYQLPPKTLRSYVFGHKLNYKPNFDSPVIFRVWKEAGKEPLVGSAWHGRIAGDGRTERFDLKTGKRSANGELEITCTRSPLNSPPPGNGSFDYKFQITVAGGGIQPTDDEFTYRSLENGYLPSFTFGQKADDPKWDVRIPIPKDYYIKTAEGHYGRLHVEWYAAQGSPAHLEWDCSINPSGSRNLER